MNDVMRIKAYHLMFGIPVLAIMVFVACQQKEPSQLTPDDYRSWNKTTDTVFNYPVPGHENHFRVIYINDIGNSVQPTQKNGRRIYDYPKGTIIVKEIYQGLEQSKNGEEPIQLAVMIKDSEHPKSRAGWLWIAVTYATKEERIIDYEFCVDCHANANEPHPYGDKNPNSDYRDCVYFPPQHP